MKSHLGKMANMSSVDPAIQCVQHHSLLCCAMLPLEVKKGVRKGHGERNSCAVKLMRAEFRLFLQSLKAAL